MFTDVFLSERRLHKAILLLPAPAPGTKHVCRPSVNESTWQCLLVFLLSQVYYTGMTVSSLFTSTVAQWVKLPPVAPAPHMVGCLFISQVPHFLLHFYRESSRWRPKWFIFCHLRGRRGWGSRIVRHCLSLILSLSLSCSRFCSALQRHN